MAVESDDSPPLPGRAVASPGEAACEPEIASSAEGAADPARAALDICRVPGDCGPLRLLRKISGPREPGFSVVIQRSALEAVHSHGRSDTTVEICGVLVGELFHDRISPYLLVTAQIPGEKAASQQTQVTFTAETWNAIQSEMEKRHAGKQIVGWYHTHPGFGVFLSGMDLFIQDNFFNLPHQVAWVYDPVAEIDGAFVWRNGQSDRSEFLIEENEGERTHDFRAKLPESNRPSVVASRRGRMGRWITMTFVFIGFCIATWYAMVLLRQHGFHIRLPIDR